MYLKENGIRIKNIIGINLAKDPQNLTHDRKATPNENQILSQKLIRYELLYFFCNSFTKIQTTSCVEAPCSSLNQVWLQWNCDRTDVMVLVCYEILHDQVITGSCYLCVGSRHGKSHHCLAWRSQALWQWRYNSFSLSRDLVKPREQRFG